MPTHIRAMCQWAVGTTLPRDTMQITPCFRHQSLLIEGGPEWQPLADDLAEGLENTFLAMSDNQLVVKLYDIAGEKPNRPKAIATRNVGSSGQAGAPRELSLCLSFSGGNAAPDKRGRLYVPQCMIQLGSASYRPTGTQQQNVADLVPVFSGLGGVNVDWVIWSPTRQHATKVDKWFVDDEWDHILKRGDRPTGRLSGTTGG